MDFDPNNPPEPPEDYMCCDSGCGEACVFEIYREEKARYDRQLAEYLKAHDEAASA